MREAKERNFPFLMQEENNFFPIYTGLNSARMTLALLVKGFILLTRIRNSLIFQKIIDSFPGKCKMS